jgi:replication initiation protein RepC
MKMDYTPVTPFRRAMNAVMLKHQSHATKELPPSGANKWEVLRELSASREVFKLSDRDISVLQALVSFHQATILGGNDSELIVYPSNKAICERLNGMPCSTMRRHLGRLVHAGVIIRRDSPNGKRFARKYGEDKVAFGFDLTPLVTRFQEFVEAADDVRQLQEQYKRLRVTVSLMRRDLAGLCFYGEEVRPDLGLWAELSDMAVLIARDLRRKLTLDELQDLHTRLSSALDRARDILEPNETKNMSTNESHNEQHHQNSNKDSYDSEPPKEKGERGGGEETHAAAISDEPLRQNEQGTKTSHLPNVPLGLVLTACKDIQTYANGEIRHWHEFVKAADFVRPMMGVSPDAWQNAMREMGPETASVVLAAMLERVTEIKSPGGYLRNLTQKAALGEFSCGPMVMALMRKEAA